MASSAPDPVLLTYNPLNHSATLTLNRPSHGNSITPLLQSLLLSHLASLATDDNVHSVILTGNGKFFCTGMDLGAGGESTSGGADRAWEEGTRLFEALDTFPKPTIALINGPCYGGGNGLAFVCDIRIAISSATFVLSEVQRGLVPAIISKYLLREWGPSLTRYASLTASPLPTTTLSSLSLLHSVHPTLSSATAAASELCTTLLSSAPGGMATIKRLVRTGFEGDEGEEERRKAFVEMMRPGEEAVEGIGKWRRKEKVDWIRFRKEGRKRAKL